MAQVISCLVCVIFLIWLILFSYQHYNMQFPLFFMVGLCRKGLRMHRLFLQTLLDVSLVQLEQELYSQMILVYLVYLTLNLAGLVSFPIPLVFNIIIFVICLKRLPFHLRIWEILIIFTCLRNLCFGFILSALSFIPYRLVFPVLVKIELTIPCCFLVMNLQLSSSAGKMCWPIL